MKASILRMLTLHKSVFGEKSPQHEAINVKVVFVFFTNTHPNHKEGSKQVSISKEICLQWLAFIAW